MIKRCFAFLICVFFVLFLTAGVLHAAQHLKQDHNCRLSFSHEPQGCPSAQDGCLICALFCRVFKAFSKGLAALLILLSLHFGKRRCPGTQPFFSVVLPRTPVTLRVKLND